MYQKLIPDNTPINSYFLSGTAGYILYSEVGPFYDEDVNDSLYVVTMLMFTRAKESETNTPILTVKMQNVFPDSFNAFKEEKSSIDDYYEFLKTAYPESIKKDYQQAFIAAQREALVELVEQVRNESDEDIVELLSAISSSELANLVEIEVVESTGEDESLISEVDVEEEDGVYIFTVQDGAYYEEDEDRYIIFYETLEYDINEPDTYSFTKNLITADTPEELENEYGVCGEWTEVYDDTEEDEKYSADFASLEFALLNKLFETIDDEEALVQLAETLEQDGLIEKVDDDDPKGDA